VWKGQPGGAGSEPIGEIQQETLTITTIAEPDASVPILMYHRVDDVALDEYWVSRDEFEAQMKALAAYGYEAVSTQEIYDYNYGGTDLPARPVAITFDDGYENVYTHAYPVLLEQGLFGEVLIVTDVTAISDYDRKFSRELGRGILANPHLTWPEIIEMAASGMVFGSHTSSHRDLMTLPDLELEDELLGSQQELFLQAGIAATSFSYPLGSGDDDVKLHQLLARYGYKTAVSAWQGICQTQSSDPLNLKRA
jgi:peptidoglycan/xylan/chitin deacetylase (PgdA/CDA1 family)